MMGSPVGTEEVVMSFFFLFVDMPYRYEILDNLQGMHISNGYHEIFTTHKTMYNMFQFCNICIKHVNVGYISSHTGRVFR